MAGFGGKVNEAGKTDEMEDMENGRGCMEELASITAHSG